MTDADCMRAAIAATREGIAAGGAPFGAALARAGQLVVAAHNRVRLDVDPTAHAEVVVLRQAARLLGTIALTGCTLYATCEPCPMCLAAAHWAKVERVVYGADIADAAVAGFSELHVPAAELARRGGSPLRVVAGMLTEECRQLFAEWRQRGLSAPY